MARGEQPGYSSKLGLSKSPRFRCLELSCWSLEGPVVLTHTQWGSMAPGLYSFLGTPVQSLFTPPLGKRERRLLKSMNSQAPGARGGLAGCYEKKQPFIPLPISSWLQALLFLRLSTHNANTPVSRRKPASMFLALGPCPTPSSFPSSSSATPLSWC